MPADLAQIERIFSEALEKGDVAERSAFLHDACQADTELRERVEALLAAHADADNMLRLQDDEATVSFVPVTERPGSTIGRYKLLEQIGEGGFGVVFMAEQEQPVRRRVALKIIKAGMDTKQVVARFEAERQALAMMDHPNIAKVLDAGATDTGRPYFVMELVRGVPITEYCNVSRLTTEQRLILFQTVCSAVQHAHQKGIIHRDLKPSNVLVTMHDDKAVPKVIDFGVAKATQGRLTERTLFTEFRQLVGTPTYMSPEQAQFSGLDVDTRSDIYSLGVLLYELLTGTTPICGKRVASATYDDLRRLICEEDPPSPSVRLSSLSNEELTTLARQRQSEPAHLAVSLRNDLDWIVMKCLEKDRTRRYQTANSLAEEIEHYLKHEPVEARAPTRIYRLTKYFRRNRIGVLAGLAVALALLIGLGLAIAGLLHARHQAEVARTQAVRSEEVSHFLRDMLAAAGPSVARGRDTTLLCEILDDTARRISNELTDQPVVKAELYSTLGSTYASLSDFPKAVQMFRRAAENYENGLGHHAAEYAMALSNVGYFEVHAGRQSVGKRNAQKGLQIARKANNRLILAKCLVNVAASFDAGMLNSEGIAYVREAIAIVEELNSDPLYLAELYGRLGAHLEGPENAQEAEDLLRRALATSRKHYPADHPKIVGNLYLLAQILSAAGKADESKAAVDEAYAIALKIYGPMHTMPLRLAAMKLEASVHEQDWETGEQTCEELASFAPENSDTWTLRGLFRLKQGRLDPAFEDLKRAVALSPNDAATWAPYFNLAVALAWAQRAEEYKLHCHSFLARSAGTREYIIAEVTSKASLLMPIDEDDFGVACQLADFAGQCDDPKPLMPWGQMTKSLADFRRGNFASAIEWSGRSAETPGVAPNCRAAALSIKACSYAKQGDLLSAQAALSLVDRLLADRDVLADFVWRDWAIVELLRAEAGELVELAASSAQP